MLNTGALPVKLVPAYQQQVSATLGKDSLQPGPRRRPHRPRARAHLHAAYYRFLGLVADLALIVYGILLWGLFNAIPVTLTLPGIAGMILTIGVAADANVVIFERIKEEVRHGKTVRSAVNSGYARGFKTILDANILTMLTAAVLFVFATASAQGLRAHAHPGRARQHAHRRAVHARHARCAGRLRVLQQARVHGRARPARSKRRLKQRQPGAAARPLRRPAPSRLPEAAAAVARPRAAAAAARPPPARRRSGDSYVNSFRRIYSFDYMGHKKWWFTISGIVIIAGLISLFVKGGGNPARLQLRSRVQGRHAHQRRLRASRRRRRRARGARRRRASATPRSRRPRTSPAPSSTGFQIQTAELSRPAAGRPPAGAGRQVRDRGARRDRVVSLETVGATFGSPGRDVVLKAVAIALLLILAYVSFRFQWKFAVGAIAAELHDLLIVVGIYSLTGREVTTATIAAVLTILGYSLYDTVIVYDRIRENQPKLSRMPYGDMVNRSIWETLTRSINTTMITLHPGGLPAALRRRHAQGLRLRAARRHPVGGLLVDLRGQPHPHGAQGARAAVPQACGARRRSVLSAPPSRRRPSSAT